jgi:hypothetical protein
MMESIKNGQGLLKAAVENYSRQSHPGKEDLG